MDHNYIDEHDVAALYLRDKLDPNERERFEKHFASCPECMDRIALAELFLQAATPQVHAPVEPLKPDPVRGFNVHIAHVEPWRLWTAITLGAVLLVGLPTAFFAGLLRGGGARVYALPATRGLIGASAATIMPLTQGVNRIRVASSTVLMMEPRTPSANSTYRVRLVDATGILAWERELQAAPGGPIAVIVPAGALRPGTYSLRLMAIAPDGSQIQLDDFTISAGLS